MSPDPILVAHSTVTAAAGLADRVTVNVRSSPSSPEASLTESSAWAVGALASAIVPVPVASAIRTPAGRPADGADRVTVNVSSPSTTSSATAATVNV